MNRKYGIIFLMVISLSFLVIATTEGEWTVHYVDEDVFFAANLFEGVDIVYLQGDGMQIRSWFWFEGPVLDARRYIQEAYLSVRTPAIGITDLNASMTIYGKPSGVGGTSSYADDPMGINGPFTTNSYNVNISSFVGAGVWHNITVTDILEEINQGYYFWDGHDIGFVTLSPDTHNEERFVSSVESGYPAILYVNYGVAPPTNVTGTWIERRNGLDIYQQDLGWVNYTAFNIVDMGDGALTIHNDTTMEFASIEMNSDVYAIQNNTENSFTVQFGIYPTMIADLVPLHTEVYGILYGISNQTGWIEDLEETAFVMTTGNDNAAEGWRYYIRTVDAGFVQRNKWGQYYSRASMTNNYHWLRFTYDGSTNELELNVYSDYNMTSLLESITADLAGSIGPTNYHYSFAPYDHDNGNQENRIEGYMLSGSGQELFFIVDPTTNQTVNGLLPDLNSTRDLIDIITAGEGGNPEDPNPGGSWDPYPLLLTRFNFKLVIFVIGMILFVGTPVYGFWERPEGATWIAILYCMICGVSLLWALQNM